jgi:uroporphyrinogen III methyltransferase / synthase
VSLSRKKVVVTRARDQAREFGSLLDDAGAEVIYLPTIEIRNPESWKPLDEALKRLESGDYEWILIASRNAAVRVIARMRALTSGVPGAVRARVGAVGAKTRSALEEAGIDVDLTPETFTGDAMAKAVGPGDGRILLPRVVGGPREIVNALEALGWTVDEVPAYENAVPYFKGANYDRVKAGDFDVVTFLSPSSATNFVKLLGPPDNLWLAPGSDTNKLVACIGPKTGTRLSELGFRIDITPDEHTAKSLVQALADFFP